MCPYTGSNVTGVHPLRVAPSSSGSAAFGVRCIVRVSPSSSVGYGGGGCDGAGSLFVGHGGAACASSTGKDEHAFLVSSSSSSSSSSGGIGNPPKWRVRPPRSLSRSPQSMSISPDGRYLAAGCVDGSVLLWEWMDVSGDNLVGSWRGHHRPASCVLFDSGDTDGCTLFTGGDDGVVNAWCLQDVVDRDDRDSSISTSSTTAIRPFRTWSEHHLPVTFMCILPGAGRGSVRLVSSSLDRNLIVMELGDGGGGGGGEGGGGIGRTLARMCLPSGIRTIITDASGGRLYCGGADGNVYIVDMCEYAVRESSMSSSSDGGGGAFAYSSASASSNGGRGKSVFDGDDGPSSYVTELRGHTRAVTCLALLDPSDMALHRPSNDRDDDEGGGGSGGGVQATLLASGSEDGTVRVWDLSARSCVKVLRPWSSSSSSSSSSSLEGGGTNAVASTSSTAASLPPVTSIVVVPRSSLTSHGGISLGLSSAMSSRASKRRNADGDSSSVYKPLKGFLRGTSVIRHGIDDVDDAGSSLLGGGCAPILWPRRDESFARYWEKPIFAKSRTIASSRKRTKRPSMLDETDEVNRLREELEESRRVIERWQAVNNQLVAKLKGTSN